MTGGAGGALAVPGPGDPPLRVWEAEVEGVSGWLVVDCLRDGLAFGGTRFTPAVTRDEVCRLARAMSWKLLGHGLPVGGAKAGLRCDPRDPRLPSLLAGFAARWREPLSEAAILGKDMGATDALLDALYAHVGRPQLALAQRRRAECPGKLRELTGYIRHMTGQGAAWAADVAAGGLAGKRVAIQGAGVVGLGVAARVSELGASVVAISDEGGALLADEGLPVDRLLAAGDDARRVLARERCDFGHRAASRDEACAADADVLILAAGTGSVGGELASRVRARVVVEASNMGLTEEACALVVARGVSVVPDVIASSSSAALVARQCAAGNAYGAEEVWRLIRSSITASVERSLALAARTGALPRRAYLHLHGVEARGA